MPLILLILGLIVLKYLAVGPFADLSWWWIVAAMFGAFVWFEFIERMLGLDKHKAHDRVEKARQKRVKDSFK